MINEYDPQTVTHPGVTLYEKIQEMGLSVEKFGSSVKCIDGIKKVAML
jgi:hypothetical protein